MRTVLAALAARGHVGDLVQVQAGLIARSPPVAAREASLTSGAVRQFAHPVGDRVLSARSYPLALRCLMRWANRRAVGRVVLQHPHEVVGNDDTIRGG